MSTSPLDEAKSFLDSQAFFGLAKDESAFIECFKAEMVKGLEGRDSSLAMLPTFISQEGDIEANRKVIVIDAGGTNLRLCTVHFDERRKGHLEDFRKFPMPGTHGELQVDVFFRLFAEYLSPYLDENPGADIGFCFSYPTRVLPNLDGVLLTWSKEIQAPGVVGKTIGEELLRKIDAKERPRITILNDTVATLLSGRAEGSWRRCSSYAGFILGTGTNIAYMEQESNMSELPEGRSGSQAVNLESGGFAVPDASPIDQNFDASTLNPGSYTFEKMISGAYLGPLFREVLACAHAEGFLEAPLPTALNSLDLHHLLSNPFTATAFEGWEPGALRRAHALGQCTMDRAARLGALSIASAILKGDEGNDLLHPIGLTLDGSTLGGLWGLRHRLELHLQRILASRQKHVHLMSGDNAPILGAGIAALTAPQMA